MKNTGLTTAVLAVSILLMTSCGSGEHKACDSLSDTPARQDQRQLPEKVTIAFTGDIMMGTTFPDSLHGTGLPADDGKHIFDDVRDILSAADFAGGNLEGSFLEGPGHRRPMTNPKTCFIFRMPPKYVQNLLDAGYDFVGIANNHINDFGQPGRSSTMKTLRDAGLAHAGLKDSCETAYVVRNGVKFGIAQVGHGMNNVDVNNIDEVVRVVKELRENSDIVILSPASPCEGSPAG